MFKLICKECGYFVTNEEDAEIMFGINRLEYQSTSKYRNRCRLCRQTISDAKKSRNRFIDKARNIVYSHVKKFNRKGFNINIDDLHIKYNWPSFEIIARHIENAYNGACHYCGTDYHDTKYMVHGLADISADMIDPDGGPGWDNVRFCCLTCNRIKNTMKAHRFMRYLYLIKERAAFLKIKPIDLMLFDIKQYECNPAHNYFL